MPGAVKTISHVGDTGNQPDTRTGRRYHQWLLPFISRISVCNSAGVSLPLSLRVPAGRTSSQHRLSDGVFICSGSCAEAGIFYYPAPALTRHGKQCRHIFSGRQQATFPVLMAPVEEQVIVDSVFPGDLRHRLRAAVTAPLRRF